MDSAKDMLAVCRCTSRCMPVHVSRPRLPSGKVSTSKAANLGFDSCCCSGSLSRSSHTSSDLDIGTPVDCLVGLVVRRLPREQKIPGSNPACARIFSGSSHTSDFKIGTPVATLPGAWRYRVSTGTGRPGVSIL